MYYYIHPFKPQYFFPRGFEKDPIFRSFFQPYSFKGKVSWTLFCNSRLYRQFFKKRNIEPYIPEQAIRNILDCQSLMAFNIGTPGPEQKITALGREAGDYFFIKYGQTPLARKNVSNEYNVLKLLELKADFAPIPQDFYQDEQQVLLQTEIIRGEREQRTRLSEAILQILIELAELDIQIQKTTNSDLKQVFGHGDFCPWNIMDKNGEKVLFDWEMGGTYPLGYDLFTFLFQTNFLLHPEKTQKKIITSNKYYINHYFNHFCIKDWNPYLIAFARVKANLEKSKDEEGLYQSYKELKKYVS